MSVLPIREAIIARLDELSEAEAAEVLRFIESVQSKHNEENFDATDDPLVGFITGPTDLAERTEEFLWAGFSWKSDDAEG